MKMPLIRPIVGDEEIAAVTRVLRSGMLAQGPETVAFESDLIDYLGIKHGFCVSSATAGLSLALAALEIPTGSDILVSDFTFPATGNVAETAGFNAITIDVKRPSFSLDPTLLERAMTSETRAIIVVHPFGLSADLDPIIDFAQRNGVALIEDAACALGARYKGRLCGTFGDVGVFSFHPRKSITTGEGGLIITDSDTVADRIRLLRSHGGARNDRGYMEFDDFGFNFRMSDINAAVGRAQLSKLPAILAERRRLATEITIALSGIEGLTSLPTDTDNGEHTFQSYVVTLDPTIRRDEVISALRAKSIESTVGTYAMHDQPAFVKRYGKKELPISSELAATTLTLPLFVGMTSTDIAELRLTLVEALRSCRG